jgi:hypothetical protein
MNQMFLFLPPRSLFSSYYIRKRACWGGMLGRKKIDNAKDGSNREQWISKDTARMGGQQDKVIAVMPT